MGDFDTGRLADLVIGPSPVRERDRFDPQYPADGRGKLSVSDFAFVELRVQCLHDEEADRVARALDKNMGVSARAAGKDVLVTIVPAGGETDVRNMIINLKAALLSAGFEVDEEKIQVTRGELKEGRPSRRRVIMGDVGRKAIHEAMKGADEVLKEIEAEAVMPIDALLESTEEKEGESIEVECKTREDGNRPIEEGARAELELSKLTVSVSGDKDDKIVQFDLNGQGGFYVKGKQVKELVKSLKAKKGYIETASGDMLKVAPSEDKADATISGGNIWIMLLKPELESILKFLATQLKESTDEDGGEQTPVAEGEEEAPEEGSEETAQTEEGEEVEIAAAEEPTVTVVEPPPETPAEEAKKKPPPPPAKKKNGNGEKTVKCLACGAALPAKSKKGAKCPVCGAVWDKKKEKEADDKKKKCKNCGAELKADIKPGAKCPECKEIWDKKKEKETEDPEEPELSEKDQDILQNLRALRREVRRLRQENGRDPRDTRERGDRKDERGEDPEDTKAQREALRIRRQVMADVDKFGGRK